MFCTEKFHTWSLNFLLIFSYLIVYTNTLCEYDVKLYIIMNDQSKINSLHLMEKGV